MISCVLQQNAWRSDNHRKLHPTLVSFLLSSNICFVSLRLSCVICHRFDDYICVYECVCFVCVCVCLCVCGSTPIVCFGWVEGGLKRGGGREERRRGDTRMRGEQLGQAVGFSLICFRISISSSFYLQLCLWGHTSCLQRKRKQTTI